MLKKIGLLAALFVAAMMIGISPSWADDCPAIEGFGDIENIPVYAGSCLLAAADDGFSKYQLPTGPMKGRALSASEELQGLLQRRLYVAPAGVSANDLFENYRAALIANNFEIVFECAAKQCGSSNALLGKLVIYPPDRKMSNLGKTSEFAMYIGGDEHFLAAGSADGQRHIALYVAQNQDGAIVGNAAGRSAAHLDVVTAQDLQANMIDAAAMAKGITDEGHVAVDNVYFALGTAQLAPEAAPAIAEMAKLLTENPKLKVFIVGHTDWIGDADANLALSQARAKSVVAALVEAGIAAERIEPAGVGMLAPKASNSTDAGRTLNRRVELVER
ncbi:OmpA family protein [Devosia sp.]|uniref:OmpA family protein n=1 Tax=Devosia sp. TaxID=1871048 RepID=UPI0032655EED